MKSVNELVARLFDAVEPTANERGNQIRRAFANTGRYVVDFADEFRAEGWEQFDTDQDASYFGFWVNASRRETLTYAEGDWTHVLCPTRGSYNAEIASAVQFYREGFIAKSIEEDGTLTVYRQERSKFLLP